MKHPHNIQELLQHNPDFIGFIFYEKSPRFFGDTNDVVDTHGIVQTHGRASQPETTKKIGVFVNETVENILKIAEKYHLDGIQLHGKESPEECRRIKQGGMLLIKAFSISDATDFGETSKYEESCDYFLFDTKTSGYGGSGRKFNWDILSAYEGKVPFLLSGGISADDVPVIQTIKHPQFAGIDVNSCFEISPACKDVEKLGTFIRELRNRELL